MTLSVAPPLHDAEIPDFWRALGRTGLVDVHTHFMPDAVLRKVWAYFDAVPDADGEPGGWPITYRTDESERLATLRGLGVRRFTSLFYPHKPGMAAWLNDWGTRFAAAHDDVVHSATFFPEPEADRYVAEALEAGARIFKVHLQVGAYDPRDPLLTPVWRRLDDAGVPIIVHAGSGPLPGPFTGPDPVAAVLHAHPTLHAVFAHMGAPEYADFLDHAERYEHVHLDTTMAFTPFMEQLAAFPPELLPRLAALQDRIVLGTDFPNIPYPYARQLQALVDLGLGDDWLRAVCVDNGVRLLGLDPAALAPPDESVTDAG